MKNFFKLLFPLLLFATNAQTALGQVSGDVHRAYVNFIANNDTLRNALAGGLNSPMLSEVDLNNDGLKDLFCCEMRSFWRPIFSTFINHGTPGQADYTYAPEYEANFPETYNFYLLKDYNCDGIEDIFAFSPPSIGIASGVMVWNGYYDANNRIAFYRVVDDIYYPTNFGQSQIFVLNGDIPSIDDIDNDGDMDILSVNNLGGYIDYYKNLSQELGHGCDSLIFRYSDDCWGRFYEPTLTNTLELSNGVDSCHGRINWNPLRPTKPEDEANKNLHAGSTLLTFDIDGDNDHDVLLGDISFEDMVLGYNTRSDTALMLSQDANFPSNSLPIDLLVFPGAFLFDGNNDGKKDLFAVPFAIDRSENKEMCWFYENTGTNSNMEFTFRQKDFMVETMLDFGTESRPCFFDYDQDGLMDLVVGQKGYYQGGADIIASLSLYRNTGSANYPEYTLVDDDFGHLRQYTPSPNFFSFHPTFGDMDNDGDGDMIVGREDGQLLYLENTGGVGPAVFNSVLPFYEKIDIGAKSAPFIFDLNRDGLLDLVVGEAYGNVNYFQNTGTLSAANFDDVIVAGLASPTIQFLGQIDVRKPAYGMANGYSSVHAAVHNGNTSIFVGNIAGEIFRYTNVYDGNGNINSNFILTDSIFGGIYPGWYATMGIADINADGRLDYAVGNIRGGIQFYSEGNLVASDVQQVTDVENIAALYPNPASDMVTIHLHGGLNSEVQVRVYNVLGELVRNEAISSNTSFDLSGYPAGLYFFEFNNGRERQVEKLIVH